MSKVLILALVIALNLNFIDGKNGTCKELLRQIKQDATLLLSCMLNHTYITPVITVCEHCVGNKVNFKLYYDSFINDANCKQEFINADRLNVIQTIYDQNIFVWNKGNCDNCFNWNTGDKIFPNVTEAFTKFKVLAKSFDGCLLKNMTNACKSCFQNYQLLQAHYESMGKSDNICFDIQDYMNKTRHKWSGEYKCCKDKRSDLEKFFSLASIVLVLPIVFYYCLYTFEKSREDGRMLIENEQQQPQEQQEQPEESTVKTPVRIPSPPRRSPSQSCASSSPPPENNLSETQYLIDLENNKKKNGSFQKNIHNENEIKNYDKEFLHDDSNSVVSSDNDNEDALIYRKTNVNKSEHLLDL
uniref:Osteopetrosis-associated transmembrane protein 1 n=1 Tax=Corethrella appendiculata TaxID=1370023 RepID=U5ER95_9DIPT